MGMNEQPYDEMDWDANYREHSDDYVIGRGEFGVLMYQPYKSEILPHWKYKDEESAEEAAPKIYEMFLDYLENNDFPGADMCRKFLRMGFTRAMRYAKYPGGQKYDDDGNEREQMMWADVDKREAAVVYKQYWDKARENQEYQFQKEQHLSHDNSKQQRLV